MDALKAGCAAVLAMWMQAEASAGTYAQAFDFPDGTTSLGDRSLLDASKGQLQVRRGALQPAPFGEKDAVGIYTLPELDAVEIEGFELSVDLDWRSVSPTTDHFLIHFGDRPPETPELVRRFELDEGLAIQIEFLGKEDVYLEVFSQGHTRGRFVCPNAAALSGRWQLRWDERGLHVHVGDQLVVANLKLSGFLPEPSYRFAFSAASRSAVSIDNLTVKTYPLALPETETLVISELLVLNNEGSRDEDGDRSGWIELFNGTGHAIDLSDWTLTSSSQDRTTWTFPKTNLHPDRHLLIWASGKDRTSSELHTNFVLDQESGSLTLTPPEGNAITLPYGKQYPDVSYARTEAKAYTYHAVSTPKRPNRGPNATHGPANPVAFSIKRGLLKSPTTLRLTSSSNEPIRYTTDGSEPSQTSNLYAGAITIDKSMTVRAQAMPSGHLPGPSSREAFVMMDAKAGSFSSNLPIVVADSGGAAIDIDLSPFAPRPHRPVYVATFDLSKDTERASLTDTPSFHGISGMHVRGNSSAFLFPKKQYAWEVRDASGEDLDTALLGMPEASDWILHAPYSDKTLIRNMLAYETARKLHGRHGAVRARYVELFFNQDGGNLTMEDYRGIYLVMEKNKRGQDRIDISKLKEADESPEKITGGYIFKKDKALHDDVTFATEVEEHELGFVYPKAPTAKQQIYLQSHLSDFENALHGDQFTDPEHGYAKYIDVDSFIDLHWLVEVFREIDGFKISAYFTKDRYGKIVALPVWDYNLSLGNANYGSGPEYRGWHHESIGRYDYPWFTRLFEDPSFKRQWEQRYFELRQSVFETSTLMQLIDDLAAPLSEAIPRNFDRWPILGKYVWPNPSGFQNRPTYNSEVEWMKTWWRNRLDWIDSQFLFPPHFNQPEGGIPMGEHLTLSLPQGIEGKVFYTLDGTVPGIDRIRTTPIVSAAQAKAEILLPGRQNGGSRLKIEEWSTIAAPPNQAAWAIGNAGVGYEVGDTNFAKLIGHPVPQMANRHTSCYIRIPFTLTELPKDQELQLRIKYDDGFVAYLNGTEIARSNAPSDLDWRSKATSSRGDDVAVTWDSFEISAPNKLLRPGDNMLAIHGLNRSADSSDALWHAELVQVDRSGSGPAPGAREYTSPISLTAPTTITAAVFADQRWSSTKVASYQPGAERASSENLVISEVHAAPELPQDPLIPDVDAYEFVEMRNTGDHPISLNGLRFIEGIRCRLDQDQPLAPGSTAFVVRHRAAFESVHGSDKQILGRFDGSLRDKGETLRLVDARGNTISMGDH